MPAYHSAHRAHGEEPFAGVGFPMDPFDVMIPIALGVVFLILCFGIYAMFRGGDFGRSWSNKAMRMRVVAQFVAILILVAALWFKQQYG
jgi:hypothetical protein